jgi:hypothetical protein
MNKMIIKRIFLSIVALFLFSIVAPAAYSAELPAGTIISKDNIDKIINDTFEGHTIKSLLTDSLLTRIKDWNLKIKIKNSTPQKKDPRYDAATKKFKGTVKYDPATNECSGYQAGNPFPDIAENDPHRAEKLMWSFYYGTRGGNTQKVPHYWLLISGKTGLERIQNWYWLRYYTKGRLNEFSKGESPVVDDRYISKTLFFITAPFDLKGVGLFTLRYDAPKLEDTWVYVKSVRRTRRLSGGAWIDPVGGLDMLNDDIWVFNARPSWYKGFKVLDKRHVLVSANDTFHYDKKYEGTGKAYPAVDLENAPYWNPSTLVEWEPTEVYEIECIPPDYHPYSKKVVYMDAADPMVYMGDMYDKAGDHWKLVFYSMGPKKGEDGYYSIITTQGYYIDYKQLHASIHYTYGWFANPPEIKELDVNLDELKKAGG